MAMDVSESGMQKEGPVASRIERVTARLPSDLFLWAALASIGIAAGMRIAGKGESATFVGEWAPTFLLLGIYNKIVKVAGHDRYERTLQ